MRGRAEFFLDGLVALDTFEPGERRAVFRQSIASLARAGIGEASSQLERLDPVALAKSVGVALADGLFDDLGWLAPEDAAVALYELAGALTLGPARREIGRRVLSQLYEGKAATFVALATRMATGSARALSGAGIRARVALALAVPPHVGVVAADPLAHALVTRRELAADWLSGATGSLPERRLAGKLLERAAREAATRARAGDDEALRPFRAAFLGARAAETDPLATSFRNLLADRETLVWRHVAAARGLLAGALPEAYDEIQACFAPTLSPTEWRRGAASLVASFAVDPETGLVRAFDILDGPLLKRDPGIAIAMIWGVPRAADAEPEACDELLARIATTHALYAAEALAEMRERCRGVGDDAAKTAAAAIRATLDEVGEEEVDALARDILQNLEGEGETDLATSIEAALGAFVEEGTREARALAQKSLGDAATIVATLEMIQVDAFGTALAGRRGQAATLLRAFDRHVLEGGALKSLLLLDRAASQEAAGVAALDDLDERLAKWLLRCESNAQPADEPPRSLALHQRQLRAFLHLLDGDSSEFENEPEKRTRVQARWARTSRLLLTRLAEEGDSPFRRSVTATLARAFDALVRDGAADAADVLLYAAKRSKQPADLAVLGEASMHPEVSQLLEAYARFDKTVVDNGGDVAPAALEAMLREMPQGATQRTEGLRGTLLKLARALSAIASADRLGPLAELDGSPLVELEDALSRLLQLTQTAHRRCGDDSPPESHAGSGAYPLAVAVGRALAAKTSGGNASAADLALEPFITATVAAAGRTLPRAIASAVAAVLPRIAQLSVAPEAPRTEAPPPSRSIPPPSMRELRLPAWMPARRTLGGFYVVRALGHGSGGSVYVVTRAEERHEADAERFALKVPDYDANAARALSEADFLRLFRQEASALLTLPEHPNLAHFVTFDAGAKPKPILVMELVEGSGVDQLLDRRALTMPSAFAILDGVLAGLEVMHAAGVGHLDIKPSNVILRAGDGPHATARAVLVDFGLAGRHIRPGCGTGNYVAPEVWVEGKADPTATPMTADVYAFGCFAFELLTGLTLFDAPNEVALISAHLTHDGLPQPMKKLAADPKLEPIAMTLYACLRKRAVDRLDTATLRKDLAKSASLSYLAAGPWQRPANSAR